MKINQFKVILNKHMLKYSVTNPLTFETKLKYSVTNPLTFETNVC